MSRDAAALELRSAADTLLRFIAIPPPDSAYPRTLADVQLEETLRFYTELASYGFSARIASTAQEPVGQLANYMSSPTTPTGARAAYATSIERWIICAIDPHAASPPHGIRWSQIVAWGWADELKAPGRTMAGEDTVDDGTWAALFAAHAAYMEGTRINGERGGVDERRNALEGADGKGRALKAVWMHHPRVPDDLSSPSAIWARPGPHGTMNVLTPFIVPDLVNGSSNEEESEEADGETITAPLSPTPRSIKMVRHRCYLRLGRSVVVELPLHFHCVAIGLSYLSSTFFASAPHPFLRRAVSHASGIQAQANPSLCASLCFSPVWCAGRSSAMDWALAISRAEVVRGFMRVFMLAHGTKGGVPVEEGGDGEVFRDAVVTRLMEELLRRICSNDL
ncbi:unnamed protein product [Peniophora sp. CBMAI 1063]|nr:unnamed protein product [Peniophora sp. CBMAI 1063]